jgi:hypothetical protein
MNVRGRIGLAILGVLVVASAARVWLGYRAPPQLPASDEVYKSVDALFTAVTSRDEQRLAACEERLKNYHNRALLPDRAWQRLSGVITTAKNGQWDTAAHRLYDFIQGQRRAGSPTKKPSQFTAMSAKQARAN